MKPAGFRVACALSGALLCGTGVWAQPDASGSAVKTTAAQASGAAQAPDRAEASKDAFGRDTPRGTLLGFMRAARDQSDDEAVAYLNTRLRGPAAAELARQLYRVLDTRLPVRLSVVSDRPEGAVPNPLKPDVDIVGTIDTARGPLDIVVERVNRGASGRIWLFSSRTLESIPDVYHEIDLVTIDQYLPRPLATSRLAGIRLFDWLILFLVVPLVYYLIGLLGRLVGPIITFRRRRAVAGRAVRLDPAPGFVRLLVLAIVIRWLVGGVDLPLIERQFWSATTAMFAVVAAVWMLLLVNARVEAYLRRRFAGQGHGEVAAPLRLVRRVADVIVVVAAAIVTLRFYGFDPTAALAGLGIGGIAVALAAQKTLENVIGGLSIIFDKAVRVGDFLKVGETSGTVDYIGLRSTRIRTPDRTIVSLPNGQIANVGIETISSRDKFWFHHVVGVRYQTTSRQLRAVIDGVRSRLAAHPSMDVESVRVRLFRFGPSSLDIELFAYIFASDWGQFMEIQEELLLGVMEIVERSGAAIALPSQTLYVAGGRPVESVTSGTAAAEELRQ
jgi:MscS family membrane protein